MFAGMESAVPMMVNVSAAKTMSVADDEILFKDGLGERLLVRDINGKPVNESLRIRTELSSVPSFEFALNERLWLVEKFDHAGFLTVRNIISLPGRLPTISLIHDLTGGIRLSDVLARSESHAYRMSAGAVAFLMREVLGILSELHRQSGDLAHGALAPERIVIADGRVRIADYVLGPAIEQLRYQPERYWKELRVAVPTTAGYTRLDRRVDVAQVAMIGVAMFLGRPLRDNEHLGGLGDALISLSLPQPIRGWLLRALHMDPRRVFVHAGEALQALTEALNESQITPAPKDLEAAIADAGAPVTPFRTAAPSRPVAVVAPPVIKPPVPAVKPPVAVLKPPATVPVQKPQRDVWHGHDVDARTYHSPGSTVASRTPVSTGFKRLVWVGLVAMLMTAAFTAAQYIPAPEWLFSKTGTLVIESNPDRVPVFVNGKSQGVTPLTLRVESGMHEVELRGPGKPRIFKVHVTRGDRVAQYIEFPRGR